MVQNRKIDLGRLGVAFERERPRCTESDLAPRLFGAEGAATTSHATSHIRKGIRVEEHGRKTTVPVPQRPNSLVKLGQGPLPLPDDDLRHLRLSFRLGPHYCSFLVHTSGVFR